MSKFFVKSEILPTFDKKNLCLKHNKYLGVYLYSKKVSNGLAILFFPIKLEACRTYDKPFFIHFFAFTNQNIV